jgi:hypothetical protein
MGLYNTNSLNTAQVSWIDIPLGSHDICDIFGKTRVIQKAVENSSNNPPKRQSSPIFQLSESTL